VLQSVDEGRGAAWCVGCGEHAVHVDSDDRLGLQCELAVARPNGDGPKQGRLYGVLDAGPCLGGGQATELRARDGNALGYDAAGLEVVHGRPRERPRKREQNGGDNEKERSTDEAWSLHGTSGYVIDAAYL
jgi:hypothetical protein